MKKYFILLGSLQAFIAIGAIPAGLMFLLDTSGKLLGMKPEFLENSPFDSFLLPGLFLLLVNGIGSGYAAYLSFSGNKQAGKTAIILGAVLCIWIVFQYFWLSETSFLQPVILITGFLELAAGWKILKS
jgi:hypothetical protein